MEFKIIVKGNSKHALEECARRLPDECASRVIFELENETLLDVCEYPDDSKAMWKWLSSGPQNAPFEPGTLLHFRFTS